MELLTDLVAFQNGGDCNYFKSQRNRFLYSVKRITQICPAPCTVLDIGSHYLHQAALLSLLGYKVIGMDVPLFTRPSFIQERAALMNIENISSEAHQSGEFLLDREGQFDLVICTEILEHIAFNPVAFWRRIWTLLSPKGTVYLTTPNSFRARALLKTIFRLLTFQGVGISINEVLSTITYGHHWKEYSCSEIKQYFRKLSPDFSVRTRTYPDSESLGTLKGRTLELVAPFRTNIEAVISLSGKSKFADSPALPMMAMGK
jgi:2-polyprenyl-3-methyl-5-hydroxy-6-metoxy-1,4-benzoquinol methylase